MRTLLADFLLNVDLGVTKLVQNWRQVAKKRYIAQKKIPTEYDWLKVSVFVSRQMCAIQLSAV